MMTPCLKTYNKIIIRNDDDDEADYIENVHLKLNFSMTMPNECWINRDYDIVDVIKQWQR